MEIHQFANSVAQVFNTLQLLNNGEDFNQGALTILDKRAGTLHTECPQLIFCVTTTFAPQRILIFLYHRQLISQTQQIAISSNSLGFDEGAQFGWL